MKKLEKAFKKVFGIKDPSEDYLRWLRSIGRIDEMHSLTNRDEPTEDKKTTDEWVWVNGYKATDKDMKCRDFQYELNKRFDMPEDANVSICSGGFHLCTALKDTFNYYGARDGNRYFHVRALVRKSELERVNDPINEEYNRISFALALSPMDSKLAAKSIEFLSEVSREELERCIIDKYTIASKLSAEYLARVPNISVYEAREAQQTGELENAGYPYRLAKYIMKYGGNDAYDRAMELSAIDDITLDTKVLLACGVGSIEED